MGDAEVIARHLVLDAAGLGIGDGRVKAARVGLFAMLRQFLELLQLFLRVLRLAVLGLLVLALVQRTPVVADAVAGDGACHHTHRRRGCAATAAAHLVADDAAGNRAKDGAASTALLLLGILLRILLLLRRLYVFGAAFFARRADLLGARLSPHNAAVFLELRGMGARHGSGECGKQ